MPGKEKPLRIALVHPDLGIGGAERLVVDAAVGLQSRGHSIDMLTSHHDPSHCFEETRDGTLNVSVLGDWLPRQIMGKGHILFAILRGVVLALSMLLPTSPAYDVIVVDQLSASIPILRFTNAKILFYCHFPDKLLTKRESFLKKLYRIPVDLLEEATTKAADEIVVNSKFTARIFKGSFPSIKRVPQVLYPCIHLPSYSEKVDMSSPLVSLLASNKKTILSINRFERKKNIELAVLAFSELLEKKNIENDAVRLVVAGGYDPRVEENKEYLRELESLAASLGLNSFVAFAGCDSIPGTTQVLFLPSFNVEQRTYLLANSTCLLYTPSNEHFGIVPVESMYAGLPVIAVNSGGPMETIIDGKTGFLLQPEPAAFADAIYDLISGGGKAKELGQAGKKLVEETFTSVVFIDALEAIIRSTVSGKNPEASMAWYLCLSVGAWVILVAVAVAYHVLI
ncbi:alpha-1,3/1,6-mannosyltransferase ALG2 [Powellomyces hirtus]|nr:alpha-1,3/1,6-mannosyltransferase ALG2 [Powellomyces hirtus]